MNCRAQAGSRLLKTADPRSCLEDRNDERLSRGTLGRRSCEQGSSELDFKEVATGPDIMRQALSLLRHA